MKRHAPATARNSAAIAEVLAKELPATGTVLEIASGSGEHALYFARAFPQIAWQPTDFDVEALESIAAWSAEAGLSNIATPLQLDAGASDWPVDQADAMFCCNMIHISPWSATKGLFAGAERVLPLAGKLILYGPFLERDVETAPSNLQFDHSLKGRNPAWGLRQLEEIDALAASHVMKRAQRYAMPANNLTLVYQRG